ncbi:hypothetical protein BDR26DRAFT_865178 [Obelidium mucronatum]|nr:hypothetical protein BDR26DRAFT_865178 [Obelidium mucronatum]
MRCRLTGAPRWKYTFANIVYITDETSTHEITSYVLPIEIHPVPIDDLTRLDHYRLKNKLDSCPALCSSHTVLVVDMSGSMRTSDLDNGLLRGTDVVSVIEMRDEAEVVFSREPITNHFFNALLERKTKSKPASHGNYINALEEAQRLFEVDEDNDTCALLLIFMSDGKPSDKIPRGGGSVQDILSDKVESMALDYGNRFTLGTVGFAKSQDFTVLDCMAKEATNNGSTGIFLKSESCAIALSRSISRLTASLSLTRTRLSSLGHAGSTAGRKLRQIAREAFQQDVTQLSSTGWEAYWSPSKNCWNAYPVKEPIAQFVIRKNAFGEGAERIVHQVVETDNKGRILGKMFVAKDSRFIQEGQTSKTAFHQVFCDTQLRAADLAAKFNAELAVRSQSKKLAQIKFLDCYVYLFKDNGQLRGLLVEKMLDDKKYKKWNGNDGSVANMKTPSENVNLEELFENLRITPASVQTSPLAPRVLGSQERRRVTFNAAIPSKIGENHADFPQAFSHWTYYHTKREFLVCDLQGVLDTTVTPPVFEFTDPAIHCATNKKGQERKFGRTDRGKFGITDFFKTHKCNEICALMGLPSDS